MGLRAGSAVNSGGCVTGLCFQAAARCVCMAGSISRAARSTVSTVSLLRSPAGAWRQRLRGSSGGNAPKRSGLVGPKSASVGLPSAAAMCSGPLSLATTRSARRSSSMSCGSEERRVRLTKRSVSARGGFSHGRWLSQTTVQCGSALSRSQVSSRNPRHSL